MRSTSCDLAGPADTTVYMLVKGDTHDLVNNALVALTQAHSLLDGNLVEGVHRVLHVGVDALPVRSDADLDR